MMPKPMQVVDPGNLTAYQGLVLHAWPAEGIEAFRSRTGAVDRAQAVAAGLVEDRVLTDLLARLGDTCESVDEASRHVAEAADAIGEAFRKPGAPAGAADEVRRLFGPLREMASKIWALDSTEWRINPRYRAPSRPGP
jgi:hypothetical protein